MSFRNTLKRSLSPGIYRTLSGWWWFSKVYLPRRIASVAVRRNPVVTGNSSAFLDQLRGINAYRPTPMCRIMTKYGSDKGNASWHNYTTVYSEIFGKLADRPLRVFELGLGTNNVQFAHSMGVEGRPGASLRGWREIFPKALVFGADIDRGILFAEQRIETFYCDQTDAGAIRDLWAQPVLRDPMDIIIDDGWHRFAGNISFLKGSLGHLRAGGTYVVEDIRGVELDEWRAVLPTYAADYPDCDFALVELPNSLNHYDNNLLVVRIRT